MSMSNRNKMPAATIIAVFLVAAGCANAADQEKKGLTVESIPLPATDISSAPSAPVGPGLQRLVDMATKNLTAKLGIEETGIKVMEAAYVTWRDSSLGCPQPNTQYMQVLTNGSRIVLKSSAGVFHYHSGGNRQPSYCASPSKIGPLPYAPGEA